MSNPAGEFSQRDQSLIEVTEKKLIKKVNKKVIRNSVIRRLRETICIVVSLRRKIHYINKLQ